MSRGGLDGSTVPTITDARVPGDDVGGGDGSEPSDAVPGTHDSSQPEVAEVEEQAEAAPEWYVYVLLSRKGRTYVGVTTEPDRRLDQHNGKTPGGARATRAGRPWTRAALRGPLADRAEAQRIEYRLKKKRGRARIAALASIEP